ncbi:centrosomal protein of 135 kDa-like isoform X2 [Pomacea canaliculata]|uniref:centrosomal protein of 135 kDa-like isoform X2 n=1 Tax=Pomacea canaliculata TaxID=400727 RepID=UPI000D72D00E|nr:centrosomal protein of 135 kDa-like isoform X2 [Pomacea canaliculata]
MSSVTGIRFESLIHSLHELQNEKNCLEQRFNEKKTQSENLEKQVEQCNVKLFQAREMYQKMLETQKVAQQKVAQTQAQVDCMHESNKVFSDKIKDLNIKIKEERERASKNVQDFDKHMSALADSLVSARKFYKTEVLQQRVQEIENKLQSSSKQDEDNREEVIVLTKTLENLQLTQAAPYSKSDGVPYEERLLFWSLLEQEEREVSLYLQKLQAERQTLCTLLQVSVPE